MLETLQGLFEEKKNRSGSDIAGHLPLLLELVETIKPKVIIHAGIRDGHSGSAFALGAFKVGAALIDVDMEDYQNLSDSKYNFQELRSKLPFWSFQKLIHLIIMKILNLSYGIICNYYHQQELL